MSVTRLVALFMLARLIADVHLFISASRSLSDDEEIGVTFFWIPLVLYREDGKLFIEIGGDS